MRHLLFVALLALSACSKDASTSSGSGGSGSSGSSPGAPAEPTYPTMSMDEVEKALATNDATAVDCNGERTRKKHGVLPGAILISDEEAYGASELPADKSRKLIFYCSDAG